MKMIKGLAVSFACCGMLLPGNTVMAAGKEKAPVAKATASSQSLQDVVLKTGGTFTGQVVDKQGAGVDGAAVKVSLGGRQVAETVSNKDGYFSVTNLKGGIYQVQAGQGTGNYRVWTEKAAPPSAKKQVLIVSQKSTGVVRGQVPGGGLLVGAMVASVGLNIYQSIQINDLKDDNDDISDQLSDLQEQVDQIAASTP